MTQFERDVTTQLGKLSEGIKAIQDALDKDYHHLHGNGSPGLIERVKELEDWRASMHHHHGVLAAIVGFLINAAIAIYAIFKN